MNASPLSEFLYDGSRAQPLLVRMTELPPSSASLREGLLQAGIDSPSTLANVDLPVLAQMLKLDSVEDGVDRDMWVELKSIHDASRTLKGMA